MRETFSHFPKRFLLESTLPGRGRSRVFEDPLKIIAAFTPAELPAAFAAMEDARAAGEYLAGFITYEAGYALEPKLGVLSEPPSDLPLLWFVAYTSVRALTAQEGHRTFSNPAAITLTEMVPELSQATYEARVNDTLDLIRAGDIYQANFTFRTFGTLSGTPVDLYARLRRAQPVSYSAFIESEDWAILSLSPELFFEVRGNTITSRPMKGTAPRQPFIGQDEKAREKLRSDPKQRAENLMILDLIRNDIARISVPGTVKVPERFTVETYRTVHQMTSTVTAELLPDARPEEIIRALFPCGSVTGAPKIRAMEILNDLEIGPRGLYTGAIGFIDPDGPMTFNVAIRTLFLTREAPGDRWQVEAGVGGGIVADSTPSGEWEECKTKLSYLTLTEEAGREFQLLETMRWSREGDIDLLERHLDRLAASADYFAFTFSREDTLNEIADNTCKIEAKEVMLRLLLSRDGTVEIEQRPLDTSAKEEWTFALSKEPVNSKDLYLYHKTTRRQVYERALADVRRDGPCDEVLLFNEQGYLTEGSRTNLFIELKGKLLTPPLECGLLDGTLRRDLISSGKAHEKTLTLTDLEKADAIYFGNSVRGMIRARPRD